MPSPIERLIDQACARDPQNPEPPTQKEVEALLELADAAKAWKAKVPDADARLLAAVTALEELGW